MTIVFTCDIQPVGVREPLRVAVTSGHDRNNRLPFVDSLAAEHNGSAVQLVALGARRPLRGGTPARTGIDVERIEPKFAEDKIA